MEVIQKAGSKSRWSTKLCSQTFQRTDFDSVFLKKYLKVDQISANIDYKINDLNLYHIVTII